MTTVREILQYIETFAPLETAEDWDNVGLLVGRREKEVHKVLVALDPFYHVVQEAAAWGADLLLVHHPLFFSAKTVTDADDIGRTIQLLIRHDIAEISLHTNLDQAQGGVNDCLAQACGLQQIDFLQVAGVDKNGREYGYCRVGKVEETTLSEYAQFVKKALGCKGIRVVSAGRPVHNVCVGSGSCAKFAVDAVRAGCDTYVTGDEKYSNFHEAQAMGLNVIDAGHFYTETVICPKLQALLQAKFPELEVKCSETHADLIEFC